MLGARSNAGRFMETRHLFNWLNSKAQRLLRESAPSRSRSRRVTRTDRKPRSLRRSTPGVLRSAFHVRRCQVLRLRDRSAFYVSVLRLTLAAARLSRPRLVPLLHRRGVERQRRDAIHRQAAPAGLRRARRTLSGNGGRSCSRTRGSARRDSRTRSPRSARASPQNGHVGACSTHCAAQRPQMRRRSWAVSAARVGLGSAERAIPALPGVEIERLGPRFSAPCQERPQRQREHLVEESGLTGRRGQESIRARRPPIVVARQRLE